MSSTSDLQGRRLDALRAWTAFVEHGDGAEALVRPEILRSWQRSQPRVSARRRRGARSTTSRRRVPSGDDSPAAGGGRPASRPSSVVRREDGDLVLAVTDAQTRILWTYGGRVMRRKAETVNFVPAARWDDESVGTNALDLANRLSRPSMVFSAEHYAPIVHNWVCWAAPVHDPVTGAQLGVIDLSTTWDRTHPIGLATARVLARLIETAMPLSSMHPLLPDDDGADRAPAPAARQRRGHARRPAACCSTAARPRSSPSSPCTPTGSRSTGCTRWSTATRRSRSPRSRPRSRTCAPRSGGQLASRPYRLTLPVATDVDDVLDALCGAATRPRAVASYGGDLLPGTESPALVELGEYVAVALREALLANPEPHAVVRYSELAPYDAEVLEVCLAALGDRPHPAKPLLKGRLAVAGSLTST